MIPNNDSEDIPIINEYPEIPEDRDKEYVDQYLDGFMGDLCAGSCLPMQRYRRGYRAGLKFRRDGKTYLSRIRIRVEIDTSEILNKTSNVDTTAG